MIRSLALLFTFAIGVAFPPFFILFAVVLYCLHRRVKSIKAATARYEAHARAEAEYAYLMRVRKAWS